MPCRASALSRVLGLFVLLAASAPAAGADEPVPSPSPSPSPAADPAVPVTFPLAPVPPGAQGQRGSQPQGALVTQVPFSQRDFRHDILVLDVDHLLGDWWGLRTRANDAGITPTLTFVSDLLGNPVGGKRQGFTEADNLGLNLVFDLEKRRGIPGASFMFSMNQRSGANLSAIDIGNTFTTQQVFGRETFQVIDVAYQQKLLDERVYFRVGRIAAADDFLVSPYNYVFVQNGFDGVPVGIFFNAPGMSAYPNATWGGMLKVRPTVRTYLMGGLYNGDIANTHENSDHGLDWSLKGPLFAIVEAAYQRNQLPGETGHVGNYKVGAWYDGSSYANLDVKSFNTAVPGSNLIATVQRGNYGVYALFDQGLIRFSSEDEEVRRGLGVTGSVLVSPNETISQMPYFFTFGIAARGLFPQRPRDVAAFGVVHGQFSNTQRNGQRLAGQFAPNVGVQTHETVLEWTYIVRMRKGALFVQPDVQYIIRPGGTGQIPDALVVGAQVGLNF